MTWGRSTLGRCLTAAVLATSLSSAALPCRIAWAQEDNKELSRARAKFQRATELEQAGNWTSALELFREVGQVKMTPQVRFHIAWCEEKLGKLVTALGGYELAMAEADEVGPDFQAEVSAKIEDLKARIPKLVIERGRGAEAAAIELDGVALGSNYVGVEFPVDPGPHNVAAKAPAREPFSMTVEIAEREKKVVQVVLQPLVSAEPAGSSEPPVGAPETDARAGRGGKVLPLVVGGAGAVLLVASGVLFVVRQGKVSEIEDLCGGRSDGTCPVAAEDADEQRREYNALRDDANTYGTIGWATLAAGVVGVGVGATLYLTQRGASEPARSPTSGFRLGVRPGAAQADAGLSLVGSF